MIYTPIDDSVRTAAEVLSRAHQHAIWRQEINRARPVQSPKAPPPEELVAQLAEPATVDREPVEIMPFLPPPPTKTVPQRATVRRILDVVAGECGVSVDDLISPNRFYRVTRPRQIAMYLARQLTGQSLPMIGRAIGGRDHTTILHGARLVASTLETDTHLQDLVERLKTKILSEVSR